MLIPTTVDGKAYRALKLAELCSGRKGSGQRLIFEPNDLANERKTLPWANLLQTQSEWVLIPKSDPDPFKVPVEKHFMDKNIAAQQDVHEEHYSEYREARALEVMTMVLLNEVVYGEPRILDGWKYPRCQEPNAYGGRVCVGLFDARGLVVNDAGIGAVGIGRVLARR